MSLLEDSHVNHSALQENKKEQTTTATSGQKCLDSLKKLNQNSLLGRMCKELLTSKTAWYSDRCSTTWKVKVSKSNVFLFQLQASVLGTKGTEHGLLATPNTMDYLPPRSAAGTKKLMEGHRKGRTKPSNLREQMDPETMRMYPTPSAQEAGEKIVETLTSKNGSPLKPNERAYNPKTGKHVQMTLNRAVKMYPTPNATNINTPQSERVEQTKSGGFILRKKNKPHMIYGARLQDAMLYLEKEKKMYRTPQSRDWKDVAYNPITNKPKVQPSTATQVLKNNKPGGKLNPTFVEFLMGFPMNWTKTDLTESKPLETQSSHKLQEKSDLPLKKFYRTPTAMDKGDNSFKYAAKMLKGKTNRAQSKEPVQKTLSMDVAMEHLKNNKHLIETYDEKFKTRPLLPPKMDFIEYLKNNLNKKKLIEDNIIKKTTIEHWFRSDHCFSYPTIHDWVLIKPYLKELKYDYRMTFEIESDWE